MFGTHKQFEVQISCLRFMTMLVYTEEGSRDNVGGQSSTGGDEDRFWVLHLCMESAHDHQAMGTSIVNPRKLTVSEADS
jgi:hypothetical protein